MLAFVSQSFDSLYSPSHTLLYWPNLSRLKSASFCVTNGVEWKLGLAFESEKGRADTRTAHQIESVKLEEDKDLDQFFPLLATWVPFSPFYFHRGREKLTSVYFKGYSSSIQAERSVHVPALAVDWVVRKPGYLRTRPGNTRKASVR